MPKHLRHITLALIVICSLGFLQVSAQTTSTSSTEETSRAEIDSALQSIRDYFDEILDVQIGWAALNARHISNVGYGIDNTIGLNSDLRDTIEVLRKILESEVFVKSMVQYDHFWTNLVNRKKYSPTEDELENHVGELYSRNLKFDIRFIPAWDTTIADDVDIARKSETGLTYNCKIVVQGKGIFTAEISQSELETTLNQSLGDSTFKKIKKEARPVVNQSLFTGLRWLSKFKYTSFEDPSNIACVEFRAPSSKYNSGFDAYDEKLDGTYTTATIKAKNYKVPWKSIAETNNDVILAVVKKKDQSQSVTDTLKFTSETGVSYSIQQRIGDSIYLVNIPSEGIAGEKSLVATYTYSDSTGEEVTVTAGQLNIAAYTTQTMNVVIVPLVDMPSGLSVSVLQDSLNSIYGQAAIKWVVTEDDKLTVDGINTSSLDDGETSLFSNYTDDMNDIIDAYKDKKDDIDKKTEYIFLVGQAASGSGKCGYMPLKNQFGFIFVNSTCSDQLEKTIAHELGHGPFRLFHPFSTSDQNHYYRAQGSTHNLMDYTGNKKDVALNKYQWDYIHDPQSISGLFQDEEDGGYVSTKYLKSETINSSELPSSSVDEFICITPAGELITINDNVTSLNFATRFSDKIANGSLTGFTNSNGNYIGLYDFNSGSFLGYALVTNEDASEIKEKVKLDSDGNIDYYTEEKTANNDNSSSLVYLGYRNNCAIEFYTISLSVAGNKPTGQQQGNGDLIGINDLTYTSSSYLKTLTDEDACELPDLNLTELNLIENSTEIVFNPYNMSGLLMLLNIGGEIEYIYQNADYAAEDYYYRWDKTNEIWVEWDPETPQELAAEDIFLAIFEIWAYLLVENPHEFLDAAGMIPVIGEVADAVNGVWYAIEGETLEAGLSFISIIPIAGDYVGKSIRYIKRIGNVEQLINISEEASEYFVKIARRLNDAGIANLEDNLFELGVLLTNYPGAAADIERLAEEITDSETLYVVFQKFNKFDEATQISFLDDIKETANLADNVLSNNLDLLDGDLVEAWEVLHKSGVSDAVRKNTKLLENINYVSKSSTLKFSKESIESLASLSVNKGIDLMEIIDNLKYFEKYAGNTGADQILKNIIKEGTFEANAFALKAIKRADEIPSLLKGNIEGFEVLVDPNRKFTVDILTKNGKLRVFNELKSWNNFNPQYATQFTKQFSNYLKNIDGVDQLKYLFEGKGRYVKTAGNFDAAKGYLKSDIANALKNNKQELIDAIGGDQAKLTKLFESNRITDTSIDNFINKNFENIFDIID